MNRNDSVKCTIENGVLTIQLGVEMLAHAAKMHPELSEHDDDGRDGQGEWIEPEITDADQFAEEVRKQLSYEEEDGTTAVHRMFDDVIIEAIENGSEGIKTADDIIRERRKERRQSGVVVGGSPR